MNDGQPVRPANILNIVAINQGSLPLTSTDPDPEPLDPDRFAALRDEGHLVLDARNSALFGGGHIPGSYNVSNCSPEFEQRIGWITPLDVPILLVVGSDGEAAAAAHSMAFVGLDLRVKGYLAGGGVHAWAGAGLPIRTLPQLSVHTLSERLADGSALQLLDVREDEEWDLGHVAGAHSMNYKDLRDNIDALKVSRDQPLAVVCAQGSRSSTACSVLLQHGFQDLRNVAGGMRAWEAAGLPMVDRAGNAVG